MTNISERVKLLIDNERISVNKFSQLLGYERSQTIHDIINSKSKPSYDFFNKFALSDFSDKYNLFWLISGRGEMLKQNVQEKSISTPQKLSENQRTDANIQEKNQNSNDKNMTSLIRILENTIVEKDKQIEKLLDIIKKGNVQ